MGEAESHPETHKVSMHVCVRTKDKRESVLVLALWYLQVKSGHSGPHNSKSSMSVENYILFPFLLSMFSFFTVILNLEWLTLPQQGHLQASTKPTDNISGCKGNKNVQSPFETRRCGHPAVIYIHVDTETAERDWAEWTRSLCLQRISEKDSAI